MRLAGDIWLVPRGEHAGRVYLACKTVEERMSACFGGSSAIGSRDQRVCAARRQACCVLRGSSARLH